MTTNDFTLKTRKVFSPYTYAVTTLRRFCALPMSTRNACGATWVATCIAAICAIECINSVRVAVGCFAYVLVTAAIVVWGCLMYPRIDENEKTTL